MSRISSRVSFSPSISNVRNWERMSSTRFAGAGVEDRVEVRVDLLPGLGLDPRPRVRVVRVGAGPHDAVLQAQQRVELLPRQAHQPEEHRRRERDRELVGEVAAAAVDEGVDEVIDPFGDVVLLRLHAFRREQRIEDLAVLHVQRRIDAQRDERANVAEVHEPLGREAGRVAQRLFHRTPARGDHEGITLGVHRAGFEQRAVLRLRHRELEQLGEEVLGCIHDCPPSELPTGSGPVLVA